MHEGLVRKYLTTPEHVDTQIVGEIMFNDGKHIVSVFKEYLVYDDFSEYLRRFYKKSE
jgi:hypothetical protein